MDSVFRKSNKRRTFLTPNLGAAGDTRLRGRPQPLAQGSRDGAAAPWPSPSGVIFADPHSRHRGTRFTSGDRLRAGPVETLGKGR